jgi:hypothetical protein
MGKGIVSNLQESNELVAIFVTSVKTAQNNNRGKGK